MEKTARKLIIYSLAGILLSGVGAPIVQAAPQNRDDQQQQEQQRSDAQKKQEQQRSEQQRLNTQKQEQQRSEQQHLSNQRQEQQRSEQQRLNTQKQEQQRSEQQRLSNQRQNDREWQDRNNNQNNNAVRRHVYNNERYSTPYWRESGQNFEYKQPWEWRSQNHVGRRLIIDNSWDREFPGLHSYLWNGPGFWYQGIEYKDLVLFYDDEDMLVSIGFWDDGQFIMIRDDNRSYYNSNPFVLRYRNNSINLKIQL